MGDPADSRTSARGAEGPSIRLVHVDKKPGVSYAVTPDGMELPVIDVTHPAFALALSDAELTRRTEEYRRQMAGFDRLPDLLRRPLLRILLGRSRMGRALLDASGGFLGGLDTYRMKLGPDNLGPWANAADRRFVSALPPTAMRLRLQDMAHLLAEAIGPQLDRRPLARLSLLNIAGGPAMDSLNALILLHRSHPASLAGRPIAIEVFDQDEDGPAFGARALEALSAPGGALHGVQVRFSHVPYDWKHTETLEQTAADLRVGEGICAVSSEGGLFEYGDDEEIVHNLAAIRRATGEGTVVTGSVTRQTGRRPGRHPLRLAVKPRSLEAFRALAARSGWTIDRAIERPASYNVRMVRG